MKSYVTVGDVLNRLRIIHSGVAAGEGGVNKPVKRVQLLEAANTINVLKGNELILLTGFEWQEDRSRFLSLLRQLIEHNAAGLFVKINRCVLEIPSEAIAIADQKQFPIILFRPEISFAEITRDIHSLLINQHYELISNLEEYSNQLNKILLKIDHYCYILDFFHQHTGLQVAIKISEEDVQFVPELNMVRKKEVMEFLSKEPDNNFLAQHTIQIMNRNYAELFVFSSAGHLTEFEHLMLDRTATALAQHFLCNLYVEEKKKAGESEWVARWLTNELTENEITDFLAKANINSLPEEGVVVCVLRASSSHTARLFDLNYINTLLKTLFEQQGFYLVTVEYKRDLVLIFIDRRSGKGWKSRLYEGFKRFLNTDYNKFREPFIQLIGVGKFVSNLQSMSKSYETALQTVNIQERLTNHSYLHFYDDLHMYRVFSLIQQQKDLAEVMMDYLEPVMDYDRKYNGKLMETLKVYLECNGSKQETAKRLYIVRQTLYHRIEKLKKLLGKDFMEPKKRMAIEFTIMAHNYLLSRENQISS